jgi:hypothetical protein
MLNIFKRKKENSVVGIKPKTVLCIPGKWKDRSEIVTAIVDNNLGRFIFAGNVLLNINTNQGYSLEIHDKDGQMQNAFKVAGLVNRLSNHFLEEIDKHHYVIYVIGDTGNLDDAKAISEAGLAILNAGGLGLKVESTGKAFTKEHWAKLVTDFEESNLCEMFVIDSINDGQGTTYSCGMHNLGFKDTIVSNVEFQEAVQLINIFGCYQVVDKPTIIENQTFSVDAASPVFEIQNESDQPNKGHQLFENPYGMWRLKRK